MFANYRNVFQITLQFKYPDLPYYMLSVSIEQESYFKGPIVSGSILLTTVVSCRCGCYITQWPAYPERCSLLRGASCSTQVVWPWVGTWCPAVRIGYYFSRAEVPGSAKDHVCQMARRISWHREPASHMAECPWCCRNDLWFSSHGGHSYSSANIADPNCRWVQHVLISQWFTQMCLWVYVFASVQHFQCKRSVLWLVTPLK